MNYDNGFILQKTMVSTNRSLDWSLLRSSSARLLPSGRKNYHRIIHKNNPRFNRMNQRSTAEGKVKFQFGFENGKVLRLKLYEHLKF